VVTPVKRSGGETRTPDAAANSCKSPCGSPGSSFPFLSHCSAMPAGEFRWAARDFVSYAVFRLGFEGGRDGALRDTTFITS